MHGTHLASAAEPLWAAQQQQAALAAGDAQPPPPGQQWQQWPPPEGRIHLLWRRSACDRCRSKKLRCVRAKEDDTSTPCTRCLRMRYPCFTSSAKPPGRNSGRLPSASEPTAPSTDAGSGAASSSANPSNRRKGTRRRVSEDVSLAPGQNLPMSIGWPFMQHEDHDEEAEVFDDGAMLMLTPSDEYQPIDMFEFPFDKNPGGFESVAGVPLDGHPSPASHSRFHSVTLAPPTSGLHFLRELDDEREDPGAVEDQIPRPSQTPTPPVEGFPEVLLARLLESLSVQLVRLNTEPWDLGVLSVTGSTMDSGEVDVTAAEALTKGESIFNPLLSILVSGAKLLDICKMFVAPGSNRGPGEASEVTNVAAGSASHSRSSRRFFSSMHETGESRGTQGTAKRPGRPNSRSSPLFPFSLPLSSSSIKRTESCASLPSLLRTPTGQTFITAAQLLTVVSCYFQVITIYNDIFSHLLFQLSLPPPQPSPSTQQHPATISGPIPTGTTNSPTSRQRHSHHTQQQQTQLATQGGAMPSLVLAGFSVPLNAGMRMRLLVEVVEHQFEQIEHTLGLPGQYCVSTSHHHHHQQSQQHNNTTGDGVGLLAGREAAALLEAVTSLSIKTDSGGGADSAAANSIGVVASLRENLRKAQRVRRDLG